MISETAGMQLHDEAVFQAHARHHGQHVGAEKLGVCGTDRLCRDPSEQGLGGDGVEIGGHSRRVAVIGRGRPPGGEIGAAVA